MRALVTGGAGFIGSHIVDRLVEQGAAVLVVDDLSSGTTRNLNAAAEFAQVDITNPALTDIAARFAADTVVHCAAQASVIVSMAKPAQDAHTNITGGIMVRDAALAAGCRQFLYITTGGALYGQPHYLPMDEAHPIRPESGYGLSKYTLERYLEMLLPPTVPLKVLRLANVYGPRQDPHGEAGVVAIFGLRMVRGEPVTIFGDGEQTRDFVHVTDIARATTLALASPESLTVNIASGAGTSVNDIFRMLKDASGYPRDAAYAPERPGEVRHSVLSAEKARDLLRWAPQIDIATGLHETMAWVQQNAARI